VTAKVEKLLAAVARTAATTATLNSLSLPPLFIRATFFDPSSGQQRPLPPHRWFLEPHGSGVPGTTATGIPSDATGLSFVKTNASAHVSGTLWTLRWEPIGAPLGPGGEAWVDLVANDWVAATDIQPIERRRLVRLVPWTSTDQLNHGGFFEVPSNRFLFEGLLEHGDVLPLLLGHGTEEEPFNIHVDHGWFQTFLRYRYFDLLSFLRRNLPPGLIVEAVDESQGVVGAGVAVTDDGLIYVLHQRTSQQSDDLHYQFVTPEPHTIVDNRAWFEDSQNDAMSAVPQLSSRREQYVLPTMFHTFGWDVIRDERQPWPEEPGGIRAAITTPEDPLVFDLDDTVLANDALAPIAVALETPITIFDQLLAIRDPDVTFSHLSATRLNRNYLDGERFVYEHTDGASAGLDSQTRCFDSDGVLYVLDAARLPGTPSVTPALGARAATPNELVLDSPVGYPEMVDATLGCFELHLLDTLIEEFEVTTPDGLRKVHMHHLLAYVSSFLIDDFFDEVLEHLGPAADVHDEFSPRLNDSPAAFIPQNGVADGAPLAFPRHFFGHRSGPKPGKPCIRVVDGFSGKQRTHWNPNTRTVNIESKDLETFTTLAHELGHVLNLPDEYFELQSDGEVLHAAPKDGQVRHGNTRKRPFVRDSRALMNENDPDSLKGIGVQRLRYLWHHAHALNDHAPFAAVLNQDPPRPTRRFQFSDLVYQLPPITPSVLSDEQNRNPWNALGTSFAKRELLVPSGHARAVLFRLGHDQTPHRRIFGPVLSKTEEPFGGLPFVPDGLLLIDIHVQLVGQTRQARLEAADTLSFMGESAAEKPFFLVAEANSSQLERIGILWQMVFAVDAPLEATNVRILLLDKDDTTPNPMLLPPQQRPALLPMRKADLNIALLRHIIGVNTTQAGQVKSTPLELHEIASSSLIGVVQSALQEPSVGRTIHTPGDGTLVFA